MVYATICYFLTKCHKPLEHMKKNHRLLLARRHVPHHLRVMNRHLLLSADLDQAHPRRHLSGATRNVILRAIDAYLAWRPGRPLPRIEVTGGYYQPIGTVLAGALNCEDQCPGGVINDLTVAGLAPVDFTYGAAARVVLGAVQERLAKSALAQERTVEARGRGAKLGADNTNVRSNQTNQSEQPAKSTTKLPRYVARAGNKFRAKIPVGASRRHLGTFATPEAAAAAVQAAMTTQDKVAA